MTIASLQNQAADARTRELFANRQAHEAAEIIQSLNIEINNLKRKLKATADAEKANQQAQTTLNHQLANEMADYEVDQMMEGVNIDKIATITNASLVGTKPHPSATPFERWKMNHFIYSPDTPAASEAHDKHIVDMLLEAATAELDDSIYRSTKSITAKKKRSVTSSGLRPIRSSSSGRHVGGIAGGGANDFEVMGLDLLTNPQVSPSSPVMADRQYKSYFLSQSDPKPMWGQKERFNSNDTGRINLWATNPNSAMGGMAPATAAGVATTISPLKPHTSKKNGNAAGVKLKSMRDSHAHSTGDFHSNDSYSGPQSKYDKIVPKPEDVKRGGQTESANKVFV